MPVMVAACSAASRLSLFASFLHLVLSRPARLKASMVSLKMVPPIPRITGAHVMFFLSKTRPLSLWVDE